MPKTMKDLTPDDIEAAATEAWRWTPHTYAEEISNGAWQAMRAQAYVGNLIARTVARGNGRIILNWPPRHGKSAMTSYWTPIWFLDNLPDRNVILASYDANTATEWGRAVRNAFEQNEKVSTMLRADSKSASRWHTPEGGGMFCTGVGGPITGRGGDLLIIDDPIKNWQEASSSQARAHLVDWFLSTFYTRAEPGGSIIVNMTRWHDQDLTSFLVQHHSETWQVVRLPALAEDVDILGREEGEPLAPERYGVEALQNIRQAVGQDVWSAVYQQAPNPVGAGRAYANFDAGNIDATLVLRKELPLHISLDFNIRPGMHVEIGQYDTKADLFTVVDEIHAARMSVVTAIQALAKWIDAQGGWQWPELHVFGDATGKSEWAGTAQSDYDIVVQQLRSMQIHYRIRVPASNPSIKDSLMAFNDCLRDTEGRRHYRVHPRCARLLEDLNHVQTDVNGLLDKRETQLSHATDAERYRISYLRPLRPVSNRPAGRFGVTA